ncbi:hypothetical protein PF005_g16400 [Phytophthora fragariae]|uniref:Uncharacterized protein n=1 Tax=Phytophthora fragariae TaxID=53985 RepID=A0A6A3TKB6_9STRA|nr:hypothetical protein PF003_g36107 [Phytophthora fragariae]KAE8933874.1 hypothetical protein PF009_g16135 [Phytophthora fragariae]KAE9000851.1 hypothetical protein PF011_g14007 [Phytophthora fragariae]KAE9116112.1 hypothetical protein PF007_g9777 [Phytophthora fragariae]KAE9137827.1 hypothetical protein PF006_g14085 [Phytophthora fragariae]
MTTETQIIVRAAPNPPGAAGPAKPHADALAPSHEEEKPPAPASTKHSGNPEEAKDASASKNPANVTAKAPGALASQKHAKDAAEAKKSPASKKLTASATKAKTKAKKTPASSKPPRRTKKVTASSKPAAKQPPKKKGSAKEDPKTPKLPPKRTDVLRPGPHEEVSSDSSGTDTPNPGYVSGGGSPVVDVPQAPRARAPTKDHAASANCATTSPQGRSPSPDPSLRVDYEESEPDVDHEADEVERSPPRITDAQRVLHPGSPMSPKTVVVVERSRLLDASMSRRDDPPAAASEPQIITNAGATRESLLSCFSPSIGSTWPIVPVRRPLRRWVPSGIARPMPLAPKTSYSRCDTGLGTSTVSTFVLTSHCGAPGPGAPQCDKCPVVLLSDSGLARQRIETEFEAWLRHLGYPEPEFLKSPFRIDWLAQRRLRFRMAKMIADDTWSNRFFDRHKPIPCVILEEVLQKRHKSWQSQPIEPKSALGLSAPTRSVGTLKSGHEVGAVLLEASPSLPRVTTTRVAPPLYQVLVLTATPAALQ